MPDGNTIRYVRLNRKTIWQNTMDRPVNTTCLLHIHAYVLNRGTRETKCIGCCANKAKNKMRMGWNENCAQKHFIYLLFARFSADQPTKRKYNIEARATQHLLRTIRAYKVVTPNRFRNEYWIDKKYYFFRLILFEKMQIGIIGITRS